VCDFITMYFNPLTSDSDILKDKTKCLKTALFNVLTISTETGR